MLSSDFLHRLHLINKIYTLKIPVEAPFKAIHAKKNP